MKTSKVMAMIVILSFGTTGAAFAAARGGHASRSSARHLGAMGAQNTNGPASTDRDRGQDRGADRRSEDGAEHAKAGTHKHFGKKGHIKGKNRGQRRAG